MIEIKKSELEPLLLQISKYDPETKQLVAGLLKENITLGTKRILQQIHKRAFKVYQELPAQIKDIQTECGENKEKLDKELKELFDEVVKIDVEKVKFSFLENVSSTENYNFDIIDKITIQ